MGFEDANEQKLCEVIVKTQKPMPLIGGLGCKAFVDYANILRSNEKYKKVIEKGLEHLKFVFKLHGKQTSEGRYFLHEHSDESLSWDFDFVEQLKNKEGVERVLGEQCVEPRKSLDTGNTTIVLGPAGWIGNSSFIMKQLKVRKEPAWNKVVNVRVIPATAAVHRLQRKVLAAYCEA